MEIDNEYVVLCTNTKNIDEVKELKIGSVFVLELNQVGLEVIADDVVTCEDDISKIKKLIIKKNDIKVVNTDCIDILVAECKRKGVKCVYSKSLGYRVSATLYDDFIDLSDAESKWLIFDQLITKHHKMRTLREIEVEEIKKWKMKNSCMK